MTTYNGWTNYATWRVNLEIFDSLELGDFWGYESTKASEIDAYDFGQVMKDYAEEILQEQANGDGNNLVFSYAMAFISDVNWTEIAKHKIEEYADEEMEAA